MYAWFKGERSASRPYVTRVGQAEEACVDFGIGLSVEVAIKKDSPCMSCVSAAQASRRFKCMRPKHQTHNGMILCTVKRLPASTYATISPSQGFTVKK